MSFKNHPAPSLLFVLILGAVVILVSRAAAAQDRQQNYAEELKRAQANLASQQYNDAIRGFMRANKLKEDRSPECYWGIAEAYFELGTYPVVIENCDQVLKYASDDSARAQAHYLKGNALVELAGEKSGALAQAEGEYRAALALKISPPMPVLHFSLGTVLLKEGQVAAGLEELNIYLQLEAAGPDGRKSTAGD